METIGALAANHAKCTKQNAQTVEMTVKFHLNQQKANQSIAETAMLNTDHHEDSDFRIIRTEM
jgi:hypothetical protein